MIPDHVCAFHGKRSVRLANTCVMFWLKRSEARLVCSGEASPVPGPASLMCGCGPEALVQS